MRAPTGKSLFKITPGLRSHHNYRLDSAWSGDYLTRLPDRSLVKLADYPGEFQEFTSHEYDEE